jgi:hypothetical protein
MAATPTLDAPTATPHVPAVGAASPRDALGYWLGLPFRWAYQVFHNGHGVLRVLDITRFRPMPHGLLAADHPWVTGLNPATGEPIWHENVIFRTPRGASAAQLPPDDCVVASTGRFLACRVALLVGDEEIPLGPRRRMPHAINYIHGACHYNSGVLIFTDFAEALAHFTDPRFRAGVRRFVRIERREVLILFRQREYSPREFAYFVCCLRTLFPWFCNANGPKGRVLWGNPAPYPAANLITGHWVRDVVALRSPGGAEAVVRPPVAGGYFADGSYGGGRRAATWPEKLLAWATYCRVRLRGSKGGMFFVDRRKAYADQIERGRHLGIADEPIARL